MPQSQTDDYSATYDGSVANIGSKNNPDIVGCPERSKPSFKQEDIHTRSSPNLTVPLSSNKHLLASGDLDRHAGVQSEPMSVQSSHSSNTTKLSSHLDVITGQSMNTSLSLTPPPSTSSVGPSASVTGSTPSYPIPHHNYFPPPSWVHPYPPQYPYAVPFLPSYFSYSYPTQHSQALHSSESCGSTSSMQTPWVGPSHSYKVCHCLASQ